MNPMAKSVLLLTVLTLTMSGFVVAGETLGARQYKRYCSLCHGDEGKGEAPYAELLKVPLVDLTQLSKKNGGAFPFEEVYEVIDGRQTVAAHGPRNMPIWGDIFLVESTDEFNPYPFGPWGNSKQYEDFVSGRISALVLFLATIQEQ